MNIDDALLSYLSQSTGLPRNTCARIALDVLAAHNETLEAFVVRRHAELKASTDLKNEQIYTRIVAEVPEQRFVVRQISARQVRRFIYG